MKRRILFAVLSVLLVVSTLLAPVSALAASKKKSVPIMQVTVDGARATIAPHAVLPL